MQTMKPTIASARSIVECSSFVLQPRLPLQFHCFNEGTYLDLLYHGVSFNHSHKGINRLLWHLLITLCKKAT